MCSSIFLIVYAVGIALGAGLTAVSIATPAWRKFENRTFSQTSGIFSVIKSCTTSNNLSENACLSDMAQEWQNAPGWKKTAMACLAGALACCAAGLAWSLVACCVCCCKSCLTPPLPLLAGLACALDVAGVALYGANSNNNEELGRPPDSLADLQSRSQFGYSMWTAIAAAGVLFVDTLVGAVLVKTSSVSPL